METLACQEIFTKASLGEVDLVWSFMHEDETVLCPFPDREDEVMRLRSLCKIQCPVSENFTDIGKEYQQRVNLSARDALHIACALQSKADFFLSCDDSLLKRASKLLLPIRLMNPIDYIRKEMETIEDSNND